ncbi:hypothetical protein [Plasmodium yoelii yoelii]|uniref:Uncharacterized protein n=1 Tax=Plasmodium yoelii yoelii TaxID=73239 RepID=Q7RF35_PLAYO|nr:hypothetical protein [Plasmodium yoelii yoelii]
MYSLSHIAYVKPSHSYMYSSKVFVSIHKLGIHIKEKYIKHIYCFDDKMKKKNICTNCFQ